MLTLTVIQKIAVWIIPVLLAVTLHEAAHAWVANRCGDSTAKMLGRLSMNPFHHVDLVGTLIVPLLVALLTQFQFVFGWAKPVPINWSQLHRPRLDMALVAAAGPALNLIMVLLWAGIFKAASLLHPESSLISYFFLLSAEAGILINLLLAFLNLIPIPPLDGSRVIASLLPPKYALTFLKLEPFGFLILLTLLFSGALGFLIRPLMSGALSLLNALLSL